MLVRLSLVRYLVRKDYTASVVGVTISSTLQYMMHYPWISKVVCPDPGQLVITVPVSE